MTGRRGWRRCRGARAGRARRWRSGQWCAASKGVGDPAPPGGGPLDGGGAGGGPEEMDGDLGGGGGGGDSMQIKRAAPGDTVGNGNGDDGPGSGRKHPDGAAPDFGSVANKIRSMTPRARRAAWPAANGPCTGHARHTVARRDREGAERPGLPVRSDDDSSLSGHGHQGGQCAGDRPGEAHRFDSAVAISTSDGFDAAVAWYRSHRPRRGPSRRSGTWISWRSNCRRSRSCRPSSSCRAAAPPTPALPATAAADRRQVAIFSPPDSANNHRGVMIVQQGSKPTTILLKRKVGS